MLAAVCIGCGCGDAQPCTRKGPNGTLQRTCEWLRIDRDVGLGVCSQCRGLVSVWDAGQRTGRRARDYRPPNQLSGSAPLQGACNLDG
jgi:hypothetical protein